MKAKRLVRITPAREGSTYQLEIEDEAGKRAPFELISDQALLLADRLDGLLADEEEERRPGPAAVPQPIPQPTQGAQVSLGTVKWFNSMKGFGFVTPDEGGEELFLYRSALDQAGLTELADGTCVRIQVGEGKKGLQVSALTLA
jgi:cold shock CspA family protein